VPPQSLSALEKGQGTNRKAHKALDQEGSLEKRKDHGRLFGAAIEVFKLQTTSEAQLQGSQKENVRCYYLSDSEIFKEFATDLPADTKDISQKTFQMNG